MNYWELRKEVSQIIPRTAFLFEDKTPEVMKTKGRKTRYKEFSITEKRWYDVNHLLNLEEIGSFIEVSCRAAACPMPLNIDVWDGMSCPFRCKYCFASTFKTYLYTAFFDNTHSMGVRHCNPNKFKKELDVYMKRRGQNPHDIKGDIAKAIVMGIPLHFGIKFEDFMRQEAKKGVSLELMKYLADVEYPVMICTKSDLVARDDYVQTFVDNKAKTALQMTLISSNNELLKQLEPGAPFYDQRIRAMKVLSDSGVRVVLRIEPYIPFLTDQKEDTQRLIEDVWDAGVRNITFDNFSYSAKNPSMYRVFRNMGMDLERILLAGCDSQALSSLLLKEYMQMFTDKGFSCSTFDMGNVPDNSQSVCCEVEDFFDKAGFNWGCSVMAARFIKSKKGKSVSWSDFCAWVNSKGGFLSPILENEVHHLWNCDGNDAYSQSWAQGMTAVGCDENGLVWCYDKEFDFRDDLYQSIRKEENGKGKRCLSKG